MCVCLGEFIEIFHVRTCPNLRCSQFNMKIEHIDTTVTQNNPRSFSRRRQPPHLSNRQIAQERIKSGGEDSLEEKTSPLVLATSGPVLCLAGAIAGRRKWRECRASDAS
jgi:hypothetical protein